LEKKEDIMGKKLCLLAIFCLLLLQVGCGGESRPNDDKPWHLFTVEEAEEVLGFDAEEEIAKIDDKLDQRIVLYKSASGDEEEFIQVSVTKDKTESSNSQDTESTGKQNITTKEFFETVKSTFSDTLKPVEEFGDEAFWNAGALHILTGKYYVTISTGHEDSPENLERAKVVAEKVMERIKNLP
jgi:hypothetical protein